MKHAGRARRDGIRLLVGSLGLVLLVLAAGVLSVMHATAFKVMAWVVAGLWVLFAGFCLNFFRDPNPVAPASSDVIVAPAYGKVDVIDETTENEFMGGPCRRVSTFLSVFDVHVQYAPAAARVGLMKYRPGKFFNAMKSELSSQNENVLIGFESLERPGEKIAVRLIAGMIARRIVPWIALEDVVGQGDRTSLIRFGSRVDLYLPLSAKIQVRLGDKVKGGETVVATRT